MKTKAPKTRKAPRSIEKAKATKAKANTKAKTKTTKPMESNSVVVNFGGFSSQGSDDFAKWAEVNRYTYPAAAKALSDALEKIGSYEAPPGEKTMQIERGAETMKNDFKSNWGANQRDRKQGLIASDGVMFETCTEGPGGLTWFRYEDFSWSSFAMNRDKWEMKYSGVDNFIQIPLGARIADSRTFGGEPRFPAVVTGTDGKRRWRGAFFNEKAGTMIQHIATNATMEELVTNDSVKLQVQETIKSYNMKKELAEVGLPPCRKILFTGPPGTGKTMSANVIADSLGLPFFVIRSEGIMNSLFGETEKNMQLLFDEIAKHAGVFLFDEADSLVVSRSIEGGVVAKTVNVLLQALEKNQSEGCIIFATNFSNKLDNAVFRRFDTVVKYELPDEESRKILIERGLHKAEADGLDMSRLVEEAEGLGHADILQACKSALRCAVLAGHKKVTTADMEKALAARVQSEDPDAALHRMFGMHLGRKNAVQEPGAQVQEGIVNKSMEGKGETAHRYCALGCGWDAGCGHVVMKKHDSKAHEERA